MRKSSNPPLAANLFRHVDHLDGVIGPRYLGKPAAFDAAAAYVERELADGDHLCLPLP